MAVLKTTDFLNSRLTLSYRNDRRGELLLQGGAKWRERCFITPIQKKTTDMRGFPQNGGTPKWMAYNGKSHLEVDDLGVALF